MPTLRRYDLNWIVCKVSHVQYMHYDHASTMYMYMLYTAVTILYKTSAYFIFCERSLLVLEFGGKLVHKGDHILGLLNVHTQNNDTHTH